MQRLALAATLPPRTPLLEQDLADLGEVMPAALPLATRDDAAAWGTLYVVEGSRLGGVMLARSVAPNLPSRYLAAAHPSGGWRAIRQAIDTAGGDASAAWHASMLAGAAATFDLYAEAARSAR